MNTLQTHFWAVRDYLAPVLRESKFKEHGRITPEEFVAAGDFLAYKFPTWTWSAASSSDPKFSRDFLPPSKQYLISRGVPCLRRVSQMENAALGKGSGKSSAAGPSVTSGEKVLNFNEGHYGEEAKGNGGEDDWLATHVDEESASAQVTDIADIPDIEHSGNSLTAEEEEDLTNRVAGTSIGDSTNAGGGAAQEGSGRMHAEIPDIPDMDDEDDDELGGLGAGVEEADDPATQSSRQAAANSNSRSGGGGGGGGGVNKLISVRTYDCLITYDKYYQTPRMWLVGYHESGQPLQPSEIFEDVSSDYAQKTVTVEPFPHSNMSTASIHPCKHASVMKKVIERMNASVVEEQRRRASVGAGSNAEAGESKQAASATIKKKKAGWGLGGAMKKMSGKETGAVDQQQQQQQQPSTTDAASSTLDRHEQDEDGAATTELEGLRVDQYLLIFLKFMASIVPAIEIDATQAV